MYILPYLNFILFLIGFSALAMFISYYLIGNPVQHDQMYIEIQFPANNEKGNESSPEYLSDKSETDYINEIHQSPKEINVYESGRLNDEQTKTSKRSVLRMRDNAAAKRSKKVRLTYGFAAQQGIRPTMEDAHFVGKEDGLFLAGICDGHNGSQAASFVSRHFYGEFKQRLVAIAYQQQEANLNHNILIQENITKKQENDVDNNKKQEENATTVHNSNENVRQKQTKQLLQSLEFHMDNLSLFNTVFNDEEIKNAIIGACEAVENRFMQFASQFDLDDGTTFCAVLLMNENLYCANIGDSRALCGGWRGVSALSLDHKAEVAEPYVRAVGGFVHPLITKTPTSIVMSGPQRIFPGGLAVSRSIGDRQFKDFEALKAKAVAKQLVTSAPDVWKLPAVGLTYAFVGCDGVFDVISSLEVHKVLMVLSAVQNSDGVVRKTFLAKAGVTHELRISGPGAIAADVITRLSLTNGSTDNVSCCALLFEHQPWPIWRSVAEKLKLQGGICTFKPENTSFSQLQMIKTVNKKKQDFYRISEKINDITSQKQPDLESKTPLTSSKVSLTEQTANQTSLDTKFNESNENATASNDINQTSMFDSSQNNNSEKIMNTCVRDYGRAAFTQICTLALESGSWTGVKGILELQDYLMMYDVLDKFFCFPDISSTAEVLFDPKLSDEQLKALDNERRSLWQDLHKKGLTLSSLRTTQAATGIDVTNEARFQTLEGQAYKF